MWVSEGKTSGKKCFSRETFVRLNTRFRRNKRIRLNAENVSLGRNLWIMSCEIIHIIISCDLMQTHTHTHTLSPPGKHEHKNAFVPLTMRLAIFYANKIYKFRHFTRFCKRCVPINQFITFATLTHRTLVWTLKTLTLAKVKWKQKAKTRLALIWHKFEHKSSLSLDSFLFIAGILHAGTSLSRVDSDTLILWPLAIRKELIWMQINSLINFINDSTVW